MCRRTSRDPLLQVFLRTYGLNLLQVPREHAAVGDVYAVRGDRVLPPGRIGDLLVPTPRLPRVRRESLAHLAGLLSDGVSGEAGLGLLEGFLTALGGGALIGRVRLHYEIASVRSVRFRIEDASREYVDIAALGRAVMACAFQLGHPIAGPDFRHYMTVGVVRTSSITVHAEGSAKHAAALKASAPLTGEATGSVAVERSGEEEIRYRGSSPLAIGVELVELVFDGKDGGGLTFKPQGGPVRARGRAERAFIGPADGDAFVRIG